MAYVVVAFWASKEFFDACITFNHEVFIKGYELERLECWSQVTEHYQGLDLSFLDEREFEGEPFDGVATLLAPTKVPPDVLAIASEAIPAKPIAVELLVMYKRA